MKKQKLISVMMGLALMVILSACGTQKASAGAHTVKIGILQLIDQKALNDARKGFTEELAKAGYTGKKMTLDYVNAQGDQSNLKTMSEKLSQDHNDLNLAIATPAAQAMLKADQKTPLLFTAVTDPKSAGLVTDLNAPSQNVTGVTDKVDVAGQIAFIHHAFKQAKTVGLLYNASEPNSLVQIRLAKAALHKLGLQAVSKTVASTNDVAQSALALAKQSDVIYIPTDNTVAAAMPTVGKISAEQKVPVVPADATMVHLAGVATRGINYTDLGRQTAKMAIKILKGKAIKALPVEAPDKTHLVVDQTRLKAFGLRVQDFD